MVGLSVEVMKLFGHGGQLPRDFRDFGLSEGSISLSLRNKMETTEYLINTLINMGIFTNMK
jgi:hypothetical protein